MGLIEFMYSVSWLFQSKAIVYPVLIKEYAALLYSNLSLLLSDANCFLNIILSNSCSFFIVWIYREYLLQKDIRISADLPQLFRFFCLENLRKLLMILHVVSYGVLAIFFIGITFSYINVFAI